MKNKDFQHGFIFGVIAGFIIILIIGIWKR